MAGVAPEDAGLAGGLVNVAHHLGGALGLGILTTVFATATAPGVGPHQLLAHRVGAAFTGAVVITLVALLVTGLVARAARADALPRRRPRHACATPLDTPARV
jgi:hypothetical protein